jgi:sterol desaturase/sphingolipid hydroxylase (fatty acid hydroxylase superfamily)
MKISSLFIFPLENIFCCIFPTISFFSETWQHQNIDNQLLHLNIFMLSQADMVLLLEIS